MKLVETNGFTQELRKKFDEYIDAIVSRDIVTSNFNPINIVYTADGRYGERFALVDGLGEKAAIPVNKYSRYINKRSNLRRAQRAIRLLERFKRTGQNVRATSKYAATRIP